MSVFAMLCYGIRNGFAFDLEQSVSRRFTFVVRLREMECQWWVKKKTADVS